MIGFMIISDDRVQSRRPALGRNPRRVPEIGMWMIKLVQAKTVRITVQEGPIRNPMRRVSHIKMAGVRMMDGSGFIINQKNRVRARVSITKSELRMVGTEGGGRRGRGGKRTVGRWWRRRREHRRRRGKMVMAALVISKEIRIIGQWRRDMNIPGRIVVVMN